jgi:hypothetical protein
MPVGTVTIFGIARSDGNNVDAVAVDEAGKWLSGQQCSSMAWVVPDMSNRDGQHGWFYARRYPDGYMFQFNDRRPPTNWDGQREHTDASIAPWHHDPANGSSLRLINGRMRTPD